MNIAPFAAEPAGWRVREQSRSVRIRDDSAQSAADPCGPNPRRCSHTKWRFRSISADRVGTALNPPQLPQNRPNGGSASSRDFSGFSAKQSADGPRSSESPHKATSNRRISRVAIGRGSPSISPLLRRTGRLEGPRATWILPDFLKILRSRPQLRDALNPGISPQLSRDFAEFMPTGRGFRRSSPLRRGTGRLANPRASEICRRPWRFYTSHR